MSIDQLQNLQDAMLYGDMTVIHAAVATLPADALPEARKMAGQLVDPKAAAEVLRLIDERAAKLGVALSA